MANNPPTSRSAAVLWTGVAIIGLTFAFRIADLYSLPVFIDEGNHLAWAQSLAAGHADYPILMDGKFLLGLVLAPFQVSGGAPLWQARAALALVSLISGAACIRLGRQLGSRRGGLLAGVLYAVLPFAVFHERQVLADPLMAHAGALALVFTLRVARRGRWRDQMWLAGLLAAAVLAKLTGALYLIPLVVAAAVLPRSARARARLAARYAVAVGLAAILGGLLLGSLWTRLGYNNTLLVSQRIGFVGCPALLCQGSLSEQLAQTGQALVIALAAAPFYFGWPLLLLAALAWPLSRSRARRPVAFLALSALAMLIAFWLTARAAPPRYYSFLAVPLVALAAQSIITLTRGLFAASAQRPRRWLGAALGALILIQNLPNSGMLALAPAQASLPEIDRTQYVTGSGAGTGFDQAALNYLARRPAPARYVIADLLSTSQLAAYLDLTRTTLFSWQEHWVPALGVALQSGLPIYVVEEAAAGSPPAAELLPGVQTELLAAYPRLSGQHVIRVRRVVGADTRLRAQLFSELCVQPGAFGNDYGALAQSLIEAGRPGVVLVYPPNQQAALAGRLAVKTGLRVQAIGDSWPLDVTATEAALAAATQGARTVRVVFGQESACDPQHAIESWLNEHLFRVGQQWFGALRLVEYAGADEMTQVLPAAARFGDGVTLEQVELLDSTAAPGGVVRVRLRWRAEVAPLPPLTVFIHLFSGPGIAAQYDGAPVSDLRPSTTWPLGARLAGQFALRLPRDLAPGPYQLRIGLYDPATLARLPVALADGTTAEFYVGGTVTIR